MRLMMEVISRFPAVGTIEKYRSLPLGERILYDQFVLVKLTEGNRSIGIKR